MINIKIKMFLLGMTLLLFLALRFQGAGLMQPYAPKGIVSLEFANTAASVSAIVDGYSANGLTGKLRANILIDFLFIPFYAMLFYTLAGSISVRMLGKAATIGVLLAFFSLIAGLLDVLENILMLLSSYGWYNNVTAFLTSLFASSKFFFLVLALLYIAVMGSVVIVRKKAAAN